MKRMCLLAMLTVSSMAHAEWTLVLKSPEFGENYYLDLDTLKEVDGAMQITTLQDFPGGKKEVCHGETCAYLSSSRISVRHVGTQEAVFSLVLPRTWLIFRSAD
jgi:hypothetical protein